MKGTLTPTLPPPTHAGPTTHVSEAPQAAQCGSKPRPILTARGVTYTHAPLARHRGCGTPVRLSLSRVAAAARRVRVGADVGSPRDSVLPHAALALAAWTGAGHAHDLGVGAHAQPRPQRACVTAWRCSPRRRRTFSTAVHARHRMIHEADARQMRARANGPAKSRAHVLTIRGVIDYTEILNVPAPICNKRHSPSGEKI